MGDDDFDKSWENSYSFDAWGYNEEVRSTIEVAIYDILEKGGMKISYGPAWPNFQAVHDAVEAAMSATLRYAFDEFQAGRWRINAQKDAIARWHPSSYEFDCPPAHIALRPGELGPLIWSDTLGKRNSDKNQPFDIFDVDKSDEDDRDLEWDKAWEAAFGVAKEWQSAVQATLRGLKEIKKEDHERRMLERCAKLSNEPDGASDE